VPLGGQFFVKLSDNTQVWLNSGSQLKYPVTFKKGDTRQVELLYGEAYFKVSPSSNNNGTTFKVKTKGQTIEVFGTEFNVKAYKNDTLIYTTLIEGKVSVNTKNSQEELLPGEQSIVDLEHKSLIKTKQKNVTNKTAWKDGTFIFDKQPLQEIMTTLSRWYNISVKFEDLKKQNIAFSGILNRSDDIVDLLNYFQKTEEVSFKISERTIIIE
jgi:ferric-dicitrate binding protein FerR (iron transport regulator)